MFGQGTVKSLTRNCYTEVLPKKCKIWCQIDAFYSNLKLKGNKEGFSSLAVTQVRKEVTKATTPEKNIWPKIIFNNYTTVGYPDKNSSSDRLGSHLYSKIHPSNGTKDVPYLFPIYP